MSLLVVLPLIIPLATTLLLLLAWDRRRVQRAISVAGAGALTVASLALLAGVSRHGIAVVQMGNWPAPFGITLVADLLSAIMVVLGAVTGFATVVYSLASMDRQRESFGYYPLIQVLLLGVSGAFLTGDIFNLYVWFEVMLMASFVLLALGGERAQLEGAIKYVTLNLISSAFFLAAVGVLYGLVGTLNMADAARQLRTVEPGIVTAIAMLFLVAFGIKAAVFPLFFWLPASYHTPPIAISAIFAGLLTKVGVYALIRFFTLLFVHDVAYTHTLLLVVAGFTMVTGVLGAAVQVEMRRILSFHIISQIGYMIMGLALYTPLALAGSIFYIMHHIIVKSNLFLVAGAVHRRLGSYQLDRTGGLYRACPLLAVLFLIPALSLAGIPPLSGFWAKFLLVKAGLETGDFAIVATALAVSLLTLYSMTKIWAAAFWKDAPDGVVVAEIEPGIHRRKWIVLLLPIALLAGITVFIGLLGEPVMRLAMEASREVMVPETYIRAVLGEAR